MFTQFRGLITITTAVMTVTIGLGSLTVNQWLTPPAAQARMAAAENLPAHGGVLRTVSAVEMSRFTIFLRPTTRTPNVTRNRAIAVARELVGPQPVLEAIPAMVERRDLPRRSWVFDWVVSLQPYPNLRPIPLDPRHPRLNRPSDRKPFLLIFVKASIGRFDGESYAYWAGHFWRQPCATGLMLKPQVERLSSGTWRPAPTIWDRADGSHEPVLVTGQTVRVALTVSPGVCLDRYSTVRLYFRRSYPSGNGNVQYRNWVGPQAWLHGSEAGSAWRFVWQTRFEMRPASHLLLAGWDVTTASGRISPHLLLHIRYRK